MIDPRQTGELDRAIEERSGDGEDARRLSTSALISHILSRYHAPLRKTLPFVRTLAAKVAHVHGEHNPRLIELREIVTELAETLEAYIDDEEATLFPALTSGEPDRGHAGDLLKTMRDEHAVVGGLLGRMRTEAEDYAVPDWACTSYRTLFRELERLEADVLRHVQLENHVVILTSKELRMATSSAERSIAELLTEDHDEIDVLFEKAVKGDSAALSAFKIRLRAHMQIEEELLFPLLVDPSLSAPLAVMKREHDRLRGLLDEDDFEFIATCLGGHNSKEERIIYPACKGPRFASLVSQIGAALSASRGVDQSR